MTDPTTRIRNRLIAIVEETARHNLAIIDTSRLVADAIMREFALRPVAQGVVDSESGEVAPRA